MYTEKHILDRLFIHCHCSLKAETLYSFLDSLKNSILLCMSFKNCFNSHSHLKKTITHSNILLCEVQAKYLHIVNADLKITQFWVLMYSKNKVVMAFQLPRKATHSLIFFLVTLIQKHSFLMYLRQHVLDMLCLTFFDGYVSGLYCICHLFTKLQIHDSIRLCF